jgi:mannitol/fructose-specific phosphotransferase system IIA component (Ntr-type)
MKELLGLMTSSGILLDLKANDLEEAISQSLAHGVERGIIDEEARASILSELLKREQASSTSIGHGVSVPHAYFDFLAEPIVFFTRLEAPVAATGPDGVPVSYIFTLLGPPDQASEHLETLMRIARLMSDDAFRYELGEADSIDEVEEAFGRFKERTSPDSPPESMDEGTELVRTGRLFGGIAADIRRRLPFYKQDFADGLHPKALGSTLFLFFACIAPAITFGGFMASVTGGAIGAVEMLVATAIGGIVYALFSAQPLTILGGTGPLLVLTEVLYILCHQLEIPFLPTYAWVGIWTAVMTLILAVTDASALIRYFTRFTDEIFAALISLIFIVEALQKLLDGSGPTESVFFSLFLGLGTFYIASTLSRFRKSRFLRSGMREFLADFGATIAVILMSAFAYFYFTHVELDALTVPEKIQTTSGRPWMIDLFGLPAWVIGAAIGPAIVTTILVYLDQNITARLVNNKENKLERGAGYHLDLTVVGVLIGIFSLFGLPWLVAATVRSLNHVRSLATTDEIIASTGDKKDRIIHVRENRVTGLAIHVLIGASILFLLPYLGLIPMPVLYGLFLFMGVVSMGGNQFFERLSLWVMDPKRYPSNHYMRRVPVSVTHKFTALQAACLAILWAIKTSALAILFPLFIALLVPIRMLAGRKFEAEHLVALDAEEEPDEGNPGESGPM